MAEPTATDRAIAEGGRVSTGIDDANFEAEFKAIQAELGGPDDEGDAQLADAAPEGEKTTPAKGKDGRFVAKDKTKEEPAEGDKSGKSGVEGKLTVKERFELREEKRRLKAELAGREANVQAKWNELQAREQALEHIAKARQLFDAGDYDGAALAAFGVKTWNELNDAAARQFASPEYKRVKALEEKDRQREAERAKEKSDADAARRQGEETRVLNDFRGRLNESLPKSDNETVAALAAVDEKFVNAVFNQVVAAARKGEDLDPNEVAEEIVEEAREHYSKLHNVFGGRPTSMAEALKGASPDRAGSSKPVKPQKHVSRSSATEASAPPEFENDDEWLKFGEKAFKRAHAEDEAAGRQSHNWS